MSSKEDVSVFYQYQFHSILQNDIVLNTVMKTPVAVPAATIQHKIQNFSTGNLFGFQVLRSPLMVDRACEKLQSINQSLWVPKNRFSSKRVFCLFKNLPLFIK